MKRTGLLPRVGYHRDARLFVLAVEAEREECWYFNGLHRYDLFDVRRVKLVLVPPTDGRSSPGHAAARLAGIEQQLHLLPVDLRWLVLDVDRHHDLGAVLAEAFQRGGKTAVSNPCFEVWLQLHFRPEPEGVDSSSAGSVWRRLRAEAAREPWPFDREQVAVACERARARHPVGPIPLPAPGTMVWQLVEALPGRRGMEAVSVE